MIEISNKLEDKKLIQSPERPKKKGSSVGTLIPQVESSERKASFSQHERLGVFKVLGLWGRNGWNQRCTKVMKCYIYIFPFALIPLIS